MSILIRMAFEHLPYVSRMLDKFSQNVRGLMLSSHQTETRKIKFPFEDFFFHFHLSDKRNVRVDTHYIFITFQQFLREEREFIRD